MRIWMKVTLDEYELPLAVASSAAELARICGVTKNAVCSSWNHYRAGRKRRSSYICVELGEEEPDGRVEGDI